MVIGCLSLTDLPLNLSIGGISSAILGGEASTENYLTYFLFVACGPALAFIAVLFLPSTPKTREQTRRIKAAVGCGKADEEDAESRRVPPK